jgi:hypothetical protein
MLHVGGLYLGCKLKFWKDRCETDMLADAFFVDGFKLSIC